MSASGLTPTELDAAITDATQRGFEVVRSSPTTLLVDLDTIAARKQFDRVLSVLVRLYPVTGDPVFTESKSGNSHAVLTLDVELPLAERVALQAALGSDGVKEILALARADAGCTEPCLLFRPKQKGKA